MTLEYVPPNKPPTNRLTIVVSKASDKKYEHYSASFEVVEGKVEVVEEKDISTKWVESTVYSLELEDEAKVRYVRVDLRGNETVIEYVCKDSRIFYVVL